MQPFIIAVDLDGTLLRSDETLSPFTINTLRTLQQLGHHIIITTGRHARISLQFYHEIGLNSPIINNNGALCHHPQHPNWDGLYKQSIPLETAQKIIALQQQANIGWIGLETESEVFATTLDIPVNPYFPQVTDEKNVLSTQNPLTVTPVSFGWFSTEQEQPLIKEIIETHISEPLNVLTWGGILPCLDIAPEGIHKFSAVKHVAHVLDIPLERVIAFGDEENDLQLLKQTQYGIAMANGIQLIKDIAYDVTSFSNDEDGVAHYLTSFFNLG